MAFDAYDRSLDLLRTLVPLLQKMQGIDSDLAKQMRHAAQSIPLNIQEANRRKGRDRTNRFRCSLGSAAEVMACLDVGVALGYLEPANVAEALELVDRIRAMTCKLSS